MARACLRHTPTVWHAFLVETVTSLPAIRPHVTMMHSPLSEGGRAGEERKEGGLRAGREVSCSTHVAEREASNGQT